ncbi:replication initiation protein [Neolewinella agarilytica]|uniref:Protein involved in initiation of plasmid replication n=1 Tax=Neolewinella agarilytica TaxID=478744 RepID=A0A1H9HAX3_9BACT|nr:replication initiation protein [Neolewinella agarilytica]SEQ59470.1 Protein involved in initiation of plasmid replication [Neolewinella agarilytica]
MATRSRKSKKKKSNQIVLIKKANNLIESRYKFDIWETRIFLSVLSQIRRDDQEFQSYRIRYRDVINVFGLKSGDSYAYLRDGAKSLMSKKFVLNYEEKGVGREKLYHILRSVDVMQDGEEGKSGAESNEYVDVVVEDVMRPLLLQLQKNFTAYDLQNVVKLGVYPIRVYELLKQYQSIGSRKIRVDEMKIMFEVEDKYRLFGDFNRWVIRPAIKEINKYTDLLVTDTEKIKEGRRVVAMKFTFRLKNEIELAEMRGEDISQLSLELPGADPVSQAVESEEVVAETEKDQLFNLFHRDVIERFGVTPSVFMHLLDKHSRAEIEQAIGVTNRAKYNQQIKKSVAGFFVKAVKDGFTDETEEKARKERRKEEKLAIAEIEERKKLAINEKIKELTAKDPKIADKAVKKLRADAITSIFIKTKEEALGRKLTLEDFRQDRALVDAVKAKIMELAKGEFAELLAGFEEEVTGVKKATYS